jgi:hypothetical protein
MLNVVMLGSILPNVVTQSVTVLNVMAPFSDVRSQAFFIHFRFMAPPTGLGYKTLHHQQAMANKTFYGSN